jgi:hypothetical protein
MPESTCIAVVGHQPLSTKLPSQYLFIRRSSDVELNPDFDNKYTFRAKSFVWSEYAAWFENSRFFAGKEITGLFHYRCALNLAPVPFSTFPSSLMSRFLKWQYQLVRKQQNFLFVGEPNRTDHSVWQQFMDAHPESIHILKAACDIYDIEVGLSRESSETRLKSMHSYYPRNIFLTDTNFSDEWLSHSYKIATQLDLRFEVTPDNRWGGFVLERLFTLFVEDFKIQNEIDFRTFQQTYFVSFSTWAKIKLLKKLQRK